MPQAQTAIRLGDWLLDYFYKTATGTYRLPESEEEREAKAKARAAGTNRQIKRYLASGWPVVIPVMTHGAPGGQKLDPHYGSVSVYHVIVFPALVFWKAGMI